jgi:hypothetical protein
LATVDPAGFRTFVQFFELGAALVAAAESQWRKHGPMV